MLALGLLRVVGVKETTLHVNSFNAWKNRPVYDVPAEYGRIEDFVPILEKEVAVIVDENRRGVVLEEVMKQMEAIREPVVVQVSIPPELPEAAMGESELE